MKKIAIVLMVLILSSTATQAKVTSEARPAENIWVGFFQWLSKILQPFAVSGITPSQPVVEPGAIITLAEFSITLDNIKCWDGTYSDKVKISDASGKVVYDADITVPFKETSSNYKVVTNVGSTTVTKAWDGWLEGISAKITSPTVEGSYTYRLDDTESCVTLPSLTPLVWHFDINIVVAKSTKCIEGLFMCNPEKRVYKCISGSWQYEAFCGFTGYKCIEGVNALDERSVCVQPLATQVPPATATATTAAATTAAQTTTAAATTKAVSVECVVDKDCKYYGDVCNKQTGKCEQGKPMPGFEAVFAIAMLLSVAYIIHRREK